MERIGDYVIVFLTVIFSLIGDVTVVHSVAVSQAYRSDSQPGVSMVREQTGKSINYREAADNYIKDLYEHIEKEKLKRMKFQERGVDENSSQLSPNPAPIYRKNSYRYKGNGRLDANHNLRNSLDIVKTTKKQEPNSENELRPMLAIISQVLHPDRKPFILFTVTSNKILYRFEVSPEVISDNYMISVSVEKMDCKVGKNNSAKLYIGGELGESYLCKQIDNSLNNFQSVDHIIDGNHYVNVTGIGNWIANNVSATLVASIYFETSHWQYCEDKDHFSCGTKETSCNKHLLHSSRHSNKHNVNSPEIPHHLYPQYSERSLREIPSPYRCIPRKDGNGTSLLCNNHPNCGFFCNSDELNINCPKKEDGSEGNVDNCAGYTCPEYQQDKFLITVILLIIFCVFIPFGIFLFICNRSDVRSQLRSRGRCPLALEILLCPFSMSADDHRGRRQVSSNTEVPQRNHGNGVRPGRNVRGRRDQVRLGNNTRRARGGGIRRSEEVNSTIVTPPNYTREGIENFSFFDDLPPSYHDCINNKEMYPTLPFSPLPSSGEIGISVISAPSFAPMPMPTSLPRIQQQFLQNLNIDSRIPSERSQDETAFRSPPSISVDTLPTLNPDFPTEANAHICECSRHRTSSLFTDDDRGGTLQSELSSTSEAPVVPLPLSTQELQQPSLHTNDRRKST